MTREKVIISQLSFCLFVNSRFPKDIQEHLFVAVAIDGGLVEGGAEQLAGGGFFCQVLI